MLDATDSFIQILSGRVCRALDFGALNHCQALGKWLSRNKLYAKKIFNFLSAGEYLISWRLRRHKRTALSNCFFFFFFVEGDNYGYGWTSPPIMSCCRRCCDMTDGVADRVPYNRQQSTLVQTGFNCSCPLREWRTLNRATKLHMCVFIQVSSAFLLLAHWSAGSCFSDWPLVDMQLLYPARRRTTWTPVADTITPTHTHTHTHRRTCTLYKIYILKYV